MAFHCFFFDNFDHGTFIPDFPDFPDFPDDFSPGLNPLQQILRQLGPAQPNFDVSPDFVIPSFAGVFDALD